MLDMKKAGPKRFFSRNISETKGSRGGQRDRIEGWRSKRQRGGGVCIGLVKLILGFVIMTEGESDVRGGRSAELGRRKTSLS